MEELLARVAPCLGGEQPRRQAEAYIRGLLSPAERKNGWTLAQFNHDAGPQKTQRLLNEYSWNENGVRDVVRSYVVEHLAEPDGVLVVDETGFIKKGRRSAGVQRQYSGTAGRIENCQLGVFAAYVSGKGRALVDRELYLPESWANDRERRVEAGVPKQVVFATKPDLALAMVRRFRDAHPQLLRWVAGDEVYGGGATLRTWLEERQIGYVLAVACDTQVTTAVGRRRVDDLATLVPASAWETYSCADGSKGPRFYDYALLETTDLRGKTGQPLRVLVRRGRDEKAELAYFLTYSPQPVPLATLVTVAGRRAWYRHITLAMLAQAWLAVSSAHSREKHPPAIGQNRSAVGYQRSRKRIPISEPAAPDWHAMVPISPNEIRHIIGLLGHVNIPAAVVHWWSDYRRRHQAAARYYHYRRRIRAVQPSATPA